MILSNVSFTSIRNDSKGLLCPVWDIRSFRKPLAVRSNLSTPYPLTNAVFSADEKTILTSAGAETKGGRGRLIFLRRDAIGEEKVTEPKQLEIVHTLEMAANPVKVCWHSRINQVNVYVENTGKTGN